MLLNLRNMGENPNSVRFRSFVHHPIINEDGTETPNLVEGSGIQLPSNIPLSAIAADVLSDMFQRGEIEGKIILKADNAKVFIQLRDNWKPHPLSDYTTTGNQEITLQEAFGEILHVKDSQMSVHVHLCHERDWSEDRVRNTIKKLLEHYSQTHLERMQCPFSQGMLSQISRDQYPCRLSTDKIKHFGAWYERSNLADEDDPDSLTPRKPEISTQRGKKIVFSPAHEIPMLRSWYESDPKPNMAELSRFTDILNNSEFRKTREAVNLRHVNTWFKNERARWRRDSLIQDLSRPSMAVETMVVTTS